MSQPLPPDHEQRERIRTELGVNTLVEAAAGSGKTTSMVARMVALIEGGVCPIEKLAAVTFTRKAAAELRARFQIALQNAARKRGESQALLQKALQNLDQCFIGTIHSFCARLLRERPIEAGVDIAFQEIEDDADEELRRRAWDDYVTGLYVGDDPLLAHCHDLGLEPSRLEDCFCKFATYPDVAEWPTKSNLSRPNLVPAIERLATYAEHMRALNLPEDTGNDKLMPKYQDVLRRMAWARLDNEAELMEIYEIFGTAEPDVVQKIWPNGKKQALEEAERWRNFCAEAAPLLEQWRIRRYDIVLKLFRGATRAYDGLRRNASVLNYQDLLMKSAALLRSAKGNVRGYFRKRFSHILVDEFQDTDPIQSEVLLLLTADDESETDWRKCRPEPGALFAVGDPKQSIYRFRRADIVTYNTVKDIIADTGGVVVQLSTNFRSSPAHVKWVNDVFGRHYPLAATKYAPQHTAMLCGRTEKKHALSGLRILTVPKGTDWPAEFEAESIARSIRLALNAKLQLPRRNEGENPTVSPADFLIITHRKKYLSEFARALQKYGIPHQVTGGSALSEILELKLLHTCLSAVIAVENPVALVAALRSELFGCSDVTLYRFKKQGGKFSYHAEIPAGLSHEEKEIFTNAFDRLKRYAIWLDAMPHVAAIERIAADLGLVALASSNVDGELNAGALAKAIELLRGRRNQSWSAAQLVGYLGELVNNEKQHDGLALRPSSSPVVRIMNLHKVKGLEAPVVYLADVTTKREHAVELHVDRSGERTVGYMAITAPFGQHAKVLLAHPPEWQRFQDEEKNFDDAEKIRLLYVAATRACEQLVVSRREKTASGNFWRFFEPHLGTATPVADSSELEAIDEATIAVDERSVRSAQRDIRERWMTARRPSYSVKRIKDLTVSGGRKAHHPTRVESHLEHAAEWGSVIHLLLQAAARKPNADLLALAVSALKQNDLDPNFAAEAVECVLAVMKSELWKRSEHSKVRLSEVPIQTFNGSTLMRGIIDLAFEENGGWVVIDYKTGIGDKAEVADCVSLYRDQVKLYASILSEASNKPVRETGLFMVPLNHYEKL